MYASDLTDKEWEVVSKLIPAGIKSGRPRKWSVRVMLNAIFYLEKTGCQWRQLPKDFPPWKRVYNTYWRWRERGVWQILVTALREDLRLSAGRRKTPSVAIIDSQSVKTTGKGGNEVLMRARRSKAASGTLR
jgi:transposase